jgi:DNA repair exonuclease SbcCD nuclease subunit
MPVHLLPPGPDAPEDRAGSAFRLSRRDFLAGMALIGTGLAAGCSSRAGARGNPGGWYAWLSDIHIGADPAATRQGQTVAANLRAVVDEIRDADDPPRGLLINGDLALDDGQPGDYARVLDLLAPVREAGVPLHATLGNHDDRGHLRAALGLAAPAAALDDRQACLVELPGQRWLLLDSLVRTGQTGGELGDAQRTWLAARLDERPEVPAVVFLHHNLNPEWAAALHDTTAFLDVLRSRPQAKAVLFGHTHVWHVQHQDGLHLVNIPAVGYKFQPKQPIGWCLYRPHPDGAEIELHPIGRDRKKRGIERRELRWRTA